MKVTHSVLEIVVQTLFIYYYISKLLMIKKWS